MTTVTGLCMSAFDISQQWFDNLDLSHTDDGITVLRGPVADQSALHGLLHKLRDLGVPLLSVTQTDPDNPSNTNPST